MRSSININSISLLTLLLWLFASPSWAQRLAINKDGSSADSSAILDISATDKGLLLPRMDSAQRSNVTNPATGLMVYDSTTHEFKYFDGTTWKAPGKADRLGDHKASQNIRLQGHWMSNDTNNLGIFVDTSGQVGMNVIPNAPLHVLVGDTSEVTPLVQDVGGYWTSHNTNQVSQTFSVPKNGRLTKIAISLSYHSSYTIYELWKGPIRLYRGTATDTNILNFPSTPHLTQSETYTLVLFKLSISTTYFEYANNNPYPGGAASTHPDHDLKFTVYVIEEYTQFKVSDTGVHTHAITFPDKDGTPDQVLSTNGSGVLGWTDLPISDLYLSGNILNLSGNPSGVDLSPYMDNTDQQDLYEFFERLVLTGSTAFFYLPIYADNTDWQKIDTFSLDPSTSILQLSLENDSQPFQSLNLSNDIFPNPQNVDTFSLDPATNILQLSLEKDGQAFQSVDLSAYQNNTDTQAVDTFLLDPGDNILKLSIENDGQAFQSVDLNALMDNTDSQKADTFALNPATNTLQLSLQGDGEAYHSIDLSPLVVDHLGNHQASQNIELNNKYLSSDGGAEAILIHDNGNVGFISGVNIPPATKLNTLGRLAQMRFDSPSGVASHSDVLYWGLSNTANQNLRTKGFLWNIVKSSWAGDHAALLLIESRHFDSPPQGPNIHNDFMLGNQDTTLTIWAGTLNLGRAAGLSTLKVNGIASKSTAGDWLGNSDARLKKHITPLSPQQMLERLLSLKGVSFEWNDKHTGWERPEGIQYGFTAQNIREVFPSLVEEDDQGYLQTAYGTYDAMKVEALRLLHDKLEQAEATQSQLQDQLAKVEALSHRAVRLKSLLDQATPSPDFAGGNAEE